MNKKVIIGIIIVLICIAIGCILFFTLNNNNQESQNQTANINEENSSAEVNESPAEATGRNETETNETPETNTETETGKDFTGKTVIPFCTSSSSGLGQSGELLAEKANGGEWLEGHRFNSNPSDSAITEWTDSLKQ